MALGCEVFRMGSKRVVAVTLAETLYYELRALRRF